MFFLWRQPILLALSLTTKEFDFIAVDRYLFLYLTKILMCDIILKLKNYNGKYAIFSDFEGICCFFD